MNKDLVAIFEYLEREKGIKRETIIKAIEESLQVAARKSAKGAGTISVEIDPRNGEIKVIAEKEIVEEVTYPDEEILIEEARELDPTCELGQFIRVTVTPADFGRIAAQTAKQVISQKLRSAERDVIYEEYRHRIGEIVSGTVKRLVKGSTLIVDLGKVEAILPDRFYPKTEKYHVGDRIQALLWEVRDTEGGGAEVVLSRSHPEMVEQLFIQEVPELHEETIGIKKIVREAGYRTKIAVYSNDPKVDPLGACVGVRGTRVKNIIRELNNEKIDIVIYTNDPVELFQSLVHPIEPKKIQYDRAKNAIFAVVEDEDYPIVIGKRGMNARLNAELIGAEIEVKKMSEYQAALTFEKQQLSQDVGPELDMELEQVEGLNQFVIDSLKEAGYNTPRKILNAPIEELMKSTGISSEMAQDIIEKIQKIRT
ncbi:MAG: transcription termination/antitermination protein NusA [Simkania sp.]|jgi:N utilization substance protein A|uniref:Transcription termination/antitermination protein NusA n=1 Tax=Simkania negevensis (strain ATCC VR-1471 / DSM 27360 / Z) TaxID=331113 RepID=F8L9T4_SIMNZ|nr:transcription termination factor NusA [Simkania negevensis]MCB1084247.1 transcription termination/antitermination protein NusA [Simkania sp.]MCP5490735.1 transcription termination/antitermination protein NusA [Chlamydiales bacterium]CCB89633.1 transcription elongation protein nusA [Simkania negevensis Z]